MIVGSVLGVIAVVAIAIGVAIFLTMQKKKRGTQSQPLTTGNNAVADPYGVLV